MSGGGYSVCNIVSKCLRKEGGSHGGTEGKKKRKRGKREEKGERKEKDASLCMERGGKGESGRGSTHKCAKQLQN